MDMDMEVLYDIHALMPCYVVIYSLKIRKAFETLSLDYDLIIPLLDFSVLELICVGPFCSALP